MAQSARDGDALRMTPRGTAQVEKIVTAWRTWLRSELQEWLPANDLGTSTAPHIATRSAQVDAALDRLVVRLVRENELDPVAT